MLEKASSCAFTGHRIEKLPWGNDESDPRCMKLKRKLYDTADAVYQDGIRHFICGMASGSDLYFCEALLELRRYRPDITIECAIPWPGQSSHWINRQRIRYSRLMAECDYQTVISKMYSSDCFMRRNQYMVDHSRMLIAVYSGASGGSQRTILYAIRQGLDIIELRI